MKVGYARVSTLEQNLDRQLTYFENVGVDKLYTEKKSGKNLERPQFVEMMNYLREGDVLYVESFSRLSRSTKDLLDTVEKLRNKGVELVSDKEKVDTTTPQGKMVLTIFAAIYEFERENILEKQAEGIAEAKKKGKYKGRKPIPITKEFEMLANEWVRGTISLKNAVTRSGVSKSTWFRKCKQLGLAKAV